jgi:hypothetical protein
MAINIPPPPAASIAALRTALTSMIKGPAVAHIAPRLAAAMTARAAVPALTPTLSYRVYTLGLSDLSDAAANRLSAAKTSVWRHTLVSSGEVITGDVSADETGANQQFAALSASSSAAAVQSAIQSVSQDSSIAASSYDLSLLQISALGVRAVWLHDATGKAADILVPVAPVRPELDAGHHYSIADFAAALKDAAAKILANDDSRKGSA